jgi:uncharacterized membrane protein YuzA (DUF378 family)
MRGECSIVNRLLVGIGFLGLAFLGLFSAEGVAHIFGIDYPSFSLGGIWLAMPLVVSFAFAIGYWVGKGKKDRSRP